MKKNILFLFAALSLLFTACDDNKIEPVSPPQNNPQPDFVGYGDIVSEATGILLTPSTEVINLNDYADATVAIDGIVTPGALLPVAILNSTNNLPEGSSVTFKVWLSNDYQFPQYVEVNTLLWEGQWDGGQQNTYYVNTEDLNKAHVSLFGSAQKEQEVYFKLAVYINANGTLYQYAPAPEEDFVATGSINEICIKANGLSSEYNLLYMPGDANGWSFLNSTFLFGQLDDETSDSYTRYAGLAYIATQFKLTAEPDWDTDYNYGIPEGQDPGLSGDLEQGSNLNINFGTEATEPAGMYWVEAQIGDLTYSAHAITSIGICGSINGWDISNAIEMSPVEGAYHRVFSAVVTFPEGQSEFKIFSDNSWDVIPNFGRMDKAITDPEEDLTNIQLLEHGENIIVDIEEAGEYQITLLMNQWPYTVSLTPYSSSGNDWNPGEKADLYLVGSFSSWGFVEQYQFTTGENANTWILEGITLSSGDQIKAAAENWGNPNLGGAEASDINLGKMMSVVNNGENLSLTQDFTGNVYIYQYGQAYYILFEYVAP